MEAVLQLHGVAASYEAGSPIFSNVNLRLARGFVGLVGANGAGKTTLLRVLSGEIVPSEGHVERLPREAVLAVCPQRTDERTETVRRFGRARTALSSMLHLEPADLERWNTLSPGERKRWQIGAALAEEPDILLVDEPTNHLDAYARDLLCRALERFRGLGVIVSHDRGFLDALTTRTVRVHGERVTLYEGGYSAAARVWEHERITAEAEHAASRARVKKVGQKLEAARREHDARERGRSMRHRMKGPRDHDARSMAAKNLAAKAEARAGRTVALLREELARTELKEATFERDRTRGRAVHIPFVKAAQAVVFHLDERAIELGGHVVLRDVRLTVGRDERLRIAGANGAGKSTLLAALLERKRLPDESVLSLSQELSRHDVARYLSMLRELEPAVRGRVLSLFASLGSDPARILSATVPDLSPGEARKLVLSFGLGRGSSALVLDEPTNHLDLPTIERLEAALLDYEGCLVLVSHDDRFAERTTTRTCTLAGQRLR